MKYLSLLSIILISSCSHRLVPDWYDIQHHKQPVAEIEHENVVVRVENLELRPNYMVFDIEVLNNSPGLIFFDTEQISAYSSMQKYDDAELNADWLKGHGHPSTAHRSLSLEEINRIYESKIKCERRSGHFFNGFWL